MSFAVNRIPEREIVKNGMQIAVVRAMEVDIHIYRYDSEKRKDGGVTASFSERRKVCCRSYEALLDQLNEAFSKSL